MDDARTVFCGNLSESVSEELLYELFLQAAPLEKVKIPTDREGRQSSFGFVTFKHEFSVDYAINLLNGIQLYGKAITIKPRQSNNRGQSRVGPQQLIQRNTFANDLLILNSLMQQQQQQHQGNERYGEFNRNSDPRHRDFHKDGSREYRSNKDSPRDSYRPKRNDNYDYDRQRTPKKPYNRRNDDKNKRYQRRS